MASQAERDIRDACVTRLHQIRPDGRIIHELNSAGQGSIRFDLACVTPDEIILCEIKSEKDKLDRLEHQIPAMKRCGHSVIVAYHEKFLVEQAGNKMFAHYERDGTFYIKRAPDIIYRKSGIYAGIYEWVYPCIETSKTYCQDCWRDMPRAIQLPLPDAALGMLWRDELYELCCDLRISCSKSSRMGDLIQNLRWMATGRELTKGICAKLRKRRFAEADAPIAEVSQ